MLRTFETDRLKLRERTLQDMECCLEMDRDVEVVKYIPPIAKLIDGPLANKEKNIQLIKEKMLTPYPNGLGYWTVESKYGEFKGWVMLVPMDKTAQKVEMGWRLRQKAWGKGYATEAATAILNYALAELDI